MAFLIYNNAIVTALAFLQLELIRAEINGHSGMTIKFISVCCVHYGDGPPAVLFVACRTGPVRRQVSAQSLLGCDWLGLNDSKAVGYY